MPPVASMELTRRHPDTGENIQWKAFNDMPGFVYKVLNVDEKRREIDMLFRFDPDSFCFNHRHVTKVTSIVLEVDHVVREFDEAGNERVSVRKTGQFCVSDGGDAHIEGGGENGAVVLFNFRGDTDHIYDIMDDELNVVRQVYIQDFKRTLDEW